MSNELDRAKKFAELAQERVGLIERLEEIKREFSSLVDDEVSAAVGGPVEQRRGRGRPPGSSNKKSSGGGEGGITVVGRTATKEGGGDWKDLPTLLSHIAETQSRALKLADFVQLARAAGYTSDAKDFPNMVYQALLKLVKRGVLEKDQESRDYHYVGKAA